MMDTTDKLILSLMELSSEFGRVKAEREKLAEDVKALEARIKHLEEEHSRERAEFIREIDRQRWDLRSAGLSTVGLRAAIDVRAKEELAGDGTRGCPSQTCWMRP